jgi:P27 family predicted phage terminase small subunit
MPRKGRLQAQYGFPPPKLVEPVAIELPAPPSHLSDEAAAWWRQIVADFELEAHHLRLLELAAGCWDRLTEARELLQREGLTITTERGIKKNPAADIERDNKAMFARLIRELDLDTPPPAQPYMRPPSLRSNRRR